MTDPREQQHLVRLADGTVKQVNPFTGTQVWTVPGRAHRPIGMAPTTPQPLDPDNAGRWCAFCSRRYLDTTPERRRVVRRGGEWEEMEGVRANRLFETTAAFRVVPNLFEIVSYDYWRRNHGWQAPEDARRRQADYLSVPAGRRHLDSLVRTRIKASGGDPDDWDGLDLADRTIGMFASGHMVVIARHHYVPEATTDDELCGTGRLRVGDHARYVGLTVQTMRELYEQNPHVQLVSTFQNWLKPAGASFDHLHKQLVSVDDVGPDLRIQLERLRAEPDLYQRWGVDYAEQQGLVVASNANAVLVAGVGHRFPALEVWSTAPGRPWELSDAALRDWSDLLHAAHRATGNLVPTNEEWHYQPPSVNEPMPLRAVLKWRISTPAGFEGGTRIYVNSIDPWTLRDRVADALERRP